MNLKQWCQVIVASVLTLAVVVIIMAGLQAVVVDTGRQILGR